MKGPSSDLPPYPHILHTYIILSNYPPVESFPNRPLNDPLRTGEPLWDRAQGPRHTHYNITCHVIKPQAHFQGI